jgi:hypothetical protein
MSKWMKLNCDICEDDKVILRKNGGHDNYEAQCAGKCKRILWNHYHDLVEEVIELTEPDHDLDAKIRIN